MKPIIIAIDGYSSCGKSTLAKALAGALSYLYIDSGAMYRAVALFFQRRGVDLSDSEAVGKALQDLQIDFFPGDGGIRTLLNGEDVETPIRGMEVSKMVSEVAAIPAVRRALVSRQRELGRRRGIVMDGRDIGSVVFPDAELKIFLTADTEERVRRRFDELRRRQLEITREEVRENLEHRDHIDSTRDDSPLVKAQDAVVIDNTNLSEREQLAMALALANERIGIKTQLIAQS